MKTTSLEGISLTESILYDHVLYCRLVRRKNLNWLTYFLSYLLMSASFAFLFLFVIVLLTIAVHVCFLFFLFCESIPEMTLWTVKTDEKSFRHQKTFNFSAQWCGLFYKKKFDCVLLLCWSIFVLRHLAYSCDHQN